jgi:predicted HicB family RNase H-like nuclease
MKKDHLTYKGFISSIHFSAEDEVFYGKIEGIPDLVSFEGTSVSELKTAFQDAVNAYEKICAAQNKPLLKSLKGSFNVRIKKELHQKAFTYSVEHGISLNQLVQEALEKQLA